jgi:hypothetical protein
VKEKKRKMKENNKTSKDREKAYALTQHKKKEISRT